jgi:hypothetical protein
MAPDGTLMVVRARRGAAEVLEAITRPPGGVASSPRELAHGADGRFLVPRQLTAGPDGTFVLVYDDTADTRSFQDSDGRVAIISPDGRRVVQLTPTALDPPPLSRKPAFDAQGRVYFATATRDAKFGTYQLIGGTGSAVPVATGPIPAGAVPAGHPDVAVTADGRQLFTYGIGYISDCTQYSEVWASQNLDGGATEADKLVSASVAGTRDPVSGDCANPPGRVVIASPAYIDAQGAATVFTIELDATNYFISSSHRPVNGARGPRETVATLPMNGSLLLGLWLVGSTPAFTYLRDDVLWWTARNADGTWPAPRAISGGASLSGVGVAPLTNGDALVVRSEESGAKRMLARRISPDGTQSDPIVLASGLADALELASSAVAVAGDGSGNAIAAVADGDKTRYVGYDGAGPVLGGVSIRSSSAPGESRAYSLGSARDVWSAVGAPAWAFSDGSAAGGNAVAHAFGAPGRYSASVSVTDALGNTTTASGPVDVPAAVAATPRDTTAPKLTKRPSVSAGVLAFSVSEAGKAVTTVTRAAKGVRKDKKCVAPPRRKTKVRSCTRQLKVATVRATLQAGPAKLKLPAKVRRTKGTYTIALTITDAAGNTTTTKATFQVK